MDCTTSFPPFELDGSLCFLPARFLRIQKPWPFLFSTPISAASIAPSKSSSTADRYNSPSSIQHWCSFLRLPAQDDDRQGLRPRSR